MKNWRAVFAVAVMGVSPALAVIIKDSTVQAAYYGIPDSPANPFNGIATTSSGGLGCSGFAISSTTVLTAGHCVSGPVSVTFWIVNPNTMTFGANTFVADSALVNPKFDAANLVNGYDVALLTFNTPLPNAVMTYPLYQSDIGLGSNFELFGRGSCGSPLTGFAGCSDGNSLHRAMNRYDVELNQSGASVLIYDFVNDYSIRSSASGTDCPSTSALCFIEHHDFGSKDVGPNALLGKQGISIYGDSGGPSLIFNLATSRYEAVGLHSFIGCVNQPCANPPDVHPTFNPDGSFGEYAGDTSLYSLRYFVATGSNVPEPAAWISAACGLAWLGVARRKKQLAS